VRKTPTVALTVAGMAPAEVCQQVIEASSTFIADGNFYAWTLAERLGINPTGAWVRAGLSPYNTEEEVERFLEAMVQVAG
jgi:selenocysteine lyase/cysteine desulfurase